MPRDNLQDTLPDFRDKHLPLSKIRQVWAGFEEIYMLSAKLVEPNSTQKDRLEALEKLRVKINEIRAIYGSMFSRDLE